MTQQHALILLAGLAIVGLFALLSSGRRSAKRGMARVSRLGHAGGYLACAVLTAAVIVGIQWAVVANVDEPEAIVTALAIPALLAGSTVARLLADKPEAMRIKGGHR